MTKKISEKAEPILSGKQPVQEKPEPPEKEPILSALSGMMVVMVTILCNLTISRYVMHKLNVLAVDFHYMLYETVLTVVFSAGMVVLLDFVRITDALEKAESAEDFPEEGTSGFWAGNPFFLWLELSVLAGIVFVGINCGVFRLFGAESWNMLWFFAYKFVYSVLLVFLLHRIVQGRFLHPEWIKKELKNIK